MPQLDRQCETDAGDRRPKRRAYALQQMRYAGFDVVGIEIQQAPGNSDEAKENSQRREQRRTENRAAARPTQVES
jgi:hypothetical protein